MVLIFVESHNILYQVCLYIIVPVVYSSDCIHFSHMHSFKHQNIKYSQTTLGYTRIVLGDPNDNSFYLRHYQLLVLVRTCFQIFEEPSEQMRQDNCYNGNILLGELEDHGYILNESLTLTLKSL